MSKRELAKFFREIEKNSFAILPTEPIVLLSEPPKSDDDINVALKTHFDKILTEAVQKKIIGKKAVVILPDDPNKPYNTTLAKTYIYRFSTTKYIAVSIVIHRN